MSTTTKPAHVTLPDEHVYLPGVSYSTYEALVTEIEGRRRMRITYHQGRMEMMSPSQNRERVKRLMGRMIEALTEELEIAVMSVGSTTFKDELKDCGLEPDECYYVQNEANVRGRQIKLGEDPPPDLVLEVDITKNVIDRFPIYAALGFPEIWQYIKGGIVIHQLRPDGTYATVEQSRAIPAAQVKRLIDHLERSGEQDETTWIRQFRRWVADGMK